MKRRNQRGFTPSPLIRTMFGSFANITLQRQYHKPAPIDSVYPPPPPYPPGPPCPCNVFRILDAAYTALSIEERQVWRDALKKPGISAYNLFMKENLVAAQRDGKLVTCPSVSGGFSCQSLELAEEPPVWENTIGLAPPLEPPVEPPEEPIPGVNTCNLCDPHLPDDFFATFSNLGGDFAPHNDKKPMTWVEACRWEEVGMPSAAVLEYIQLFAPYWVHVWEITVQTAAGCHIGLWSPPNTPCNPFHTYSFAHCLDAGCGDTDSCENSAAATCLVTPF